MKSRSTVLAWKRVSKPCPSAFTDCRVAAKLVLKPVVDRLANSLVSIWRLTACWATRFAALNISLSMVESFRS